MHSDDKVLAIKGGVPMRRSLPALALIGSLAIAGCSASGEPGTPTLSASAVVESMSSTDPSRAATSLSPTPSPAPSPTPSSTPSPTPVSVALDYFEAVNERQSVDDLAESGTPAYAYGEYLELSQAADLAAGFATAADTTVQDVEGGFDIVFDPTLEDVPETIAFRSIESSDAGLVTDFTRNGDPIGDRLWASEPVEGDGMRLGSAYALANEGAMFVALDVTNTTDEVFIVADATFVQDGRQFNSDGQIDVVPFELGGGNTATMVFGTEALASADRLPVTMKVEGGSPERQASISAEVTMEPFGE